MKFRIPRLRFRKTVAGIVSPLQKIVKQLETHARYQHNEAANKTMAAGKLLAQSDAHRAEAKAAESAAYNIGSLFK